MKTSCFGKANSKKYKNSDLRFVSIARSCKFWEGEVYPDLFPTWDMIKLESEFQYEKLYREQILSKLDAQKVYTDLKDAVILCHEKTSDLNSGKKFCHRKMVTKWLIEELLKKGIIINIDELE